MELFEYQSFHITTKFLKNHDIIIWHMKLMCYNADEWVNVEVAMREKELGWILWELARWKLSQTPWMWMKSQKYQWLPCLLQVQKCSQSILSTSRAWHSARVGTSCWTRSVNCQRGCYYVTIMISTYATQVAKDQVCEERIWGDSCPCPKAETYRWGTGPCIGYACLGMRGFHCAKA